MSEVSGRASECGCQDPEGELYCGQWAAEASSPCCPCCTDRGGRGGAERLSPHSYPTTVRPPPGAQQSELVAGFLQLSQRPGLGSHTQNSHHTLQSCHPEVLATPCCSRKVNRPPRRAALCACHRVLEGLEATGPALTNAKQ